LQRLLRYWIVVSIVIAGAIALRHADPTIVARLRMLGFDTLQQYAPRIPDPKYPVRIVDADERSITKLGSWPWDREVYARLLDVLGRLGASAIAFDIVFPKDQRHPWANMPNTIRQSKEFQVVLKQLSNVKSGSEKFAASIGQHRVILGIIGKKDASFSVRDARASFSTVGDKVERFVPSFRGAKTNAPLLEKVTDGLGVLNWFPEHDQILRRVPMLVRINDKLYPSLAAETLRVASGSTTIEIRSAAAGGAKTSKTETGISGIRIGSTYIPTDGDGQLWLSFSPSDPHRYISVVDILEGRVKRDQIEGRIILVGTSAPGLFDLRATPLNPVTAGVEVHAQALEQMLSKRFLVRPDYSKGMEIAFTVICGVALALLVDFAGAFVGALIGALMMFGVVGFSYFAFTQLGILFDAVFPGAVLTVVYLIGTAISYFQTERERNQVRQAFSQYMAPALVEHLTREPERLKLGGEARELTIMFSDVRGFTAIAEGFRDNPGGLTSLMNRMLTPLTNSIIERKGTIDKYMGDAIMAFWNAPLDDPDHARHGCHGALDMLQRLALLNAQRQQEAEQAGIIYQPLRLGIGISTGVAVVGNMGSELRFDYSVLGDTVNLSSRLEGLTRYYGVDILVSDATYQAAAADLAAIEVDFVRVKGRESPERIWAVLGNATMLESNDFREFGSNFSIALSAYRAGQWDRSQSAYVAMLPTADRLGTRELINCFLERIELFKKSPPPDNWAGIWSMTNK
jgi:adenylate cyclase